MALRIQNNVEAFNAHRNLSGTENRLAMSMERLSSGYRINRAADDAAGLAISTAGASDIAEIDTAIDVVSAQRSTFGAIQNRLGYTLENAAIYQENLTASESRVRDVDMAKEMVNFTKLQILQQAGTSMLAQANTSSQGVLSLLR